MVETLEIGSQRVASPGGRPMKRVIKRETSVARQRWRDDRVTRAGTAENKLNRLPSLKDVKLLHPVQLTPPCIWRVYLVRRANESPNIIVLRLSRGRH